MHELETFSQGAVEQAIVEKVDDDYEGRRRAVAARLDVMADQFPEYVEATQRTVALRFSLRTEETLLEELHEHGLLSERFLRDHSESIDSRLRALGEAEAPGLLINPLEVMRLVPVFASLPATAVAQLAELLVTESHWEGEVVIREGEPAEAVYLVGRGMVEVRRDNEEGKPERLAMMRAGGFFGEMALLDGKSYPATVATVTPCTILRLATADLDRLFRTTPALGETLQRGFRDHAAAVAESLGRRQYPRMPTGERAGDIEVFLVHTATDEADEALDCVVLDVSLGGIGLGTRGAVPTGARLRARFSAPDGSEGEGILGRIVSLLGTVSAPGPDEQVEELHRQGVAFDEAPNPLAGEFIGQITTAAGTAAEEADR